MQMRGPAIKLITILAGLGCLLYFGNRLIGGPLESFFELADPSAPPEAASAAPACPQAGGVIEIVQPAPISGEVSAQTIARVDMVRGGMGREEVEKVLGMPTMVYSFLPSPSSSLVSRPVTQITWEPGDDVINIKFVDGKVSSVVAGRLRPLPTWRIASADSGDSQAAGSGSAGQSAGAASPSSGMDMNALMTAAGKQLNGKDPNEALGQLLAQGGKGQADVAALVSQFMSSQGGQGQADVAALASQLMDSGAENAELLKMLQSVAKEQK